MHQLKKVLWGQLCALWASSAWAAQETFDKTITSIPLGAVAVAVTLAFIGGLAYTLQKVAKPDIGVVSVPIEIAKDIVNSLVAGLAAFFLASWLAWPAFAVALVITFAGYGGSRFLEAGLESLLDRLKTFFTAPTTPK
jgi:hypothetical protein